MIKILKNGKVIAELNFSGGAYSIKYIEENEDIETWFFLYKDGLYHNVQHECMMPYDVEYGILNHKASLEYNGYEFELVQD